MFLTILLYVAATISVGCFITGCVLTLMERKNNYWDSKAEDFFLYSLLTFAVLGLLGLFHMVKLETEEAQVRYEKCVDSGHEATEVLGTRVCVIDFNEVE